MLGLRAELKALQEPPAAVAATADDVVELRAMIKILQHQATELWKFTGGAEVFMPLDFEHSNAGRVALAVLLLKGSLSGSGRVLPAAWGVRERREYFTTNHVASCRCKMSDPTLASGTPTRPA